MEEREDPQIIDPTDAVIRITASCICGSDLWPYRGLAPLPGPSQIGHEYVGIVEQTGAQVATVKPGDFVVGPFVASGDGCEICQAGFRSYCPNRVEMPTIGTQAEKARIPFADATLIATPGQPGAELIPSLLACSDVLGTGWFAAVSAQDGPDKSVAVVGDGAVGRAAKQLGADRIIAVSRHPERQKLALEFGATDVVAERGEDGAAHVKELTGGYGAHSTVEAVGTTESLRQAIHATRPGGNVGYVGVPVGAQLDPMELFASGVQLAGGVAPVRRFLPELIQLVWDRKINPDKVFDLTLPLDDAAEGYKAMDERQAIKVLLTT
ncbi:threonine dehydrogenase-like Zn-dependent dehydrogenase [Arthrobacter bambusae]|nr:zinc-binding dehydrogenase [Arthrobacter bambusae]MDQ0029097.1 threonine dehydrogenase-like Zn-dependent dehydrogenase [Arthrobacter bambusae]MDQ0098501.1 threonine dehydrogenase-like Zn-dependent dehydrogenase [Arthrobacter bambusae]